MKISKKDRDALKRHSYLFKSVGTVGKARRDKVLKTAPKSLFSTSKMLAKHLVRGNIPLKTNQRKKLTPGMKNYLRRLHAARSPSKFVQQDGAGFSEILRFALPIIRSLF